MSSPRSSTSVRKPVTSFRVFEFKFTFHSYILNRKFENIYVIVISAIRPDYIYMSDKEELCQNSGQRIHPVQVMPFRRNNKVADDNDDDEPCPEKFRDTVRIPEQELDHTLYDNYTWQYGIQRGLVSKLVKDSFHVRGVYRNRRFITCMVKNFYRAARQIPYPLIFRGDGVGGILSWVFLYRAKRRTPDFTDRHLHGPGIDLQELRNLGRKGVIFGDRNDVDLEVVPFQINQGGRIKRFSEDKIVDIMNDDEMDFCRIKNVRITRYNVYWEHVVEKPIEAVMEGAGDLSFESTD